MPYEAARRARTSLNIRALKPYPRPATSMPEERSRSGFDANESPYDNGLNRYPDPHQRELKRQVAALKGYARSQIFLGNGSDEAIDLAYRIFCTPGRDNAVAISPTYGMYRVADDMNDIELREVPLGRDFSLPVEALLGAADSRTKLLWLCSPNNPTGNVFPAAEIERLLRRFEGMVILDEAYIDFADGGGLSPRGSGSFRTSSSSRPPRRPGAWRASGSGWPFAAEPVAELFGRVKYPYNLNVLTQQTAARQLKAGIGSRVELIRRERGRVAEALAAAACIERVYPSQANFLLVRTAASDRLYDVLIAAGVIVRNRSRVAGCEGCLRITIGTSEANDRMLNTVNDFRI